MLKMSMHCAAEILTEISMLTDWSPVILQYLGGETELL